MPTIGETLHRERLRLGFDLDQVAQKTKIGTRLLEAMEADDFKKLPGGVFSKSFLKQYARVLGLDEEAIAAEFQHKYADADSATMFGAPLNPPKDRHFVPDVNSRFSGSPSQNSIFVSVAWVAFAVLVCAGVYYFLNRPHRIIDFSGSTPTVAKETAPAADSTRETAKSPAPPPAQPAPPEQDAAVPALNTPPVTKPATDNAEVDASGAGGLQVSVSALEPSWISITADGKPAFSGILQANEKKQIDASGKVKLVLGNAGGMEITLNGKPVGPIGRQGQVKTVELTQAGLHVVSRTPPPISDPL